MAPPIPGLRRPVGVQRRTTADVILGVLAIIALAALTAGVPFALVLIAGTPIPRGLSLSTLTSQLDLTSILKILSIIVWLAWIQLVWCVIVEVRAAVRNVGVPGRVPMAGATQSLAHRLVTAALLLFSATAALSPALAIHAAAPPRPAHSVSVQSRLPDGPIRLTVARDTGVPAVSQQAAPTDHKIYVVKPPAGRYHESLWEIAENHLGDGRRYREIFEMNSGRIQPDGTKLTIASLIRPGWVLNMPSDATGPGIETVTVSHSAPDSAQARGHAQEELSRGGGTTARSGKQGTETSGIGEAAWQQVAAAWPYELASASLLAAGVLSALGRRRRERLWQRAFGRRLDAPRGDAALAEQALRLGADDPATQLLDISLRHLSRALSERSKAPPTVFAAHLSADNLDLWVAPPDPDPPAPWTAGDGGQVWRLTAADAGALDPGDALAPYPGLVTLGTNETGRVMVDLEVAQGLIAVRGPSGTVQAALAAMAVELVTNRWSDRMRVTLVGFGEGLTLVAPERAVVARTVDDVLTVFEERAAALSQELAIAGLDSVLTGRALRGGPDTWIPHYLIVGVPPTPEQAQRLLALARTRQRTGLGLVVAGDVPGATWTWDLSAEGRLQAAALGFDVEAQLLPPSRYEAVVALFADSGGDPPVTDPSVGAAPAPHLVPGSRFAVEVGVLGPVSVSAPGPLEPDRIALATEIVAYLATHPGGVHMNVLTGAVWPRGVTNEVRDAALARVTTWLGNDQSGSPHLVTDAAGRLSLSPGVRVDWQVFRGLIARAVTSGDEAWCLERALDLVRGQALDSRDPARYAWLASDDFGYEVTALVADSAHQLATLRLAAGDASGAMDAARSGLRLAFDDEQLWRDLLRAAHASGEEPVLRSVVDEISARAALDEVMPRMAPETEALIDELLPSWRSSAA